MTGRFAQLAFTQDVQRHQREHGSDRAYRRMMEGPGDPDRIGEDERAFIETRESFYLASVGQTGWPYIQHRGGPPGFLKVLDEQTIGFADFRGNRQYITVGNLDHDERVSLFLMDYAHQARMKILGRARVEEGDSPPAVADYRAKVERTVLITVEAFDWNCHQHIPQLFPPPGGGGCAHLDAGTHRAAGAGTARGPRLSVETTPTTAEPLLIEPDRRTS